MAKRRRYDREFKLEAIRLWRSTGKSAREVEADLGITAGLLYKWHARFKDDALGDGEGSAREAEIRRLQRENEILRQERDILKKAVAIFSQPKR
jgi:transposase